MIGQSDSPAAACIALAAMSPGVTNARYETPATVSCSTSPPTPSPIAPRNSSGVRM
jgi:hypothetical protein